jgi:hypothetical protein
MIKSGIKYFWMIAAVLAAASVCLASGEKEPDWSYIYTDDFNDCNVENDSYYHSIFWPQGAFPPEAEPYLYYKNTGQTRELGFGDFHGTPAQLVYRFPFEQAQKTISGELQVDVRFLYTGTGSLRYSLSSDGRNWSNYKELISGTNVIPLKSIRGICYISFYGIGVLIDNLEVNLYTYPADYLVPSTQYPTIQDAINAAADGEVIEVASRPQSYKGTGNCDIDFNNKAITVYSSNGPDQTVIDCENTHRGFYFHRNENQDSVLRGFKIINGKKTGSSIPSDTASWSQSSSYPIGGGIYCEFSSPSIIDCIVQGCSTEYGGGIGLVGASPYIADSIIQNCNAGGFGSSSTGGYGAGIALIRDSNAVIINTAVKNNKGYNNSKGAGVYCYQSKALLINCDISSNYASSYVTGGGVYAAGAYTSIDLQNCIIAKNRAKSGAGIFSDSISVEYINTEYDVIAIACNVYITNCTIADNVLVSPQGTTGGGLHSVKSNTVIGNSIIWDNSGLNVWIDDSVYAGIVQYSDIQGGYEGQGNKNVDPCFASSSTGDYHLKSKYGRYDPVYAKWIIDTNQSECIDAGAPKDEIGPEPYPHGKRINMGAYGGTDQASMGYTPCLLHVSKTGSNSNSGMSKDAAFATIQKAVDMAMLDDVIMIWPGVYTEEVTLVGKRLTIQSADDAAEIRGTGGRYAFSFYAGEYSGCVLRNLIITNCNTEGAVFCHNVSPTLKNLTIANNAFGVVLDGGANSDIRNCIFWNNKYGDVEKTYIKNVFYSRLTLFYEIDKQRGNLDYDPGFINSNAGSGDYHLKSKYGRYVSSSGTWVTDSSNSPCIDAGDPSMYPEREPQPNGGRINMGAHGGTPFASKSSGPLFSDSNN